MTDNSKIAVLAAVVAVGAGALLMRRPKEEETKAEETWESKIPDRHGSLEEIHPNLYRLEAAGCGYGPPSRNMTIYRVPDGSKRLVIISGIAVKEDTIKAILELGTPTALLVPNTMHRDCAAVWKKRFPSMMVACPDFSNPPDGRAKVEEIVSVDMTTDELCALPEWKDWLTPKRIDGWVHFEEILQVKLSATQKAMIVTDLLFTMPKERNGGWFSDVIQWVFDSSIELPPKGKMIVPKVSRVARLFGIEDWVKAESWYRTYAKEEGPHIVAIMVGHGPPVVEVKEGEGCKEALDGVANQLIKPRW